MLQYVHEKKLSSSYRTFSHCFQQEKMVLTSKGWTRVFVARIPPSVTDDDFGRYQILDHIHHLLVQLVISSGPKCFKGRMHH